MLYVRDEIDYRKHISAKYVHNMDLYSTIGNAIDTLYIALKKFCTDSTYKKFLGCIWIFGFLTFLSFIKVFLITVICVLLNVKKYKKKIVHKELNVLNCCFAFELPNSILHFVYYTSSVIVSYKPISHKMLKCFSIWVFPDIWICTTDSNYYIMFHNWDLNIP